MTDEEIDQLEAALLNEARERARTDFYVFVQLMAPLVIPEGYVDGQHIRQVCAVLQEVAETPGSKAMITLPPRSMKSVLGSILYPAWVFGLHPYWQVLSVSHSSELATEFGRQIRNLVSTTEYQHIFPSVVISSDRKANNKWGTTKGGVYNSAGVETGVAGKGAHLGLVDDPLSEQTAFSQSGRNFVKNWWGPGFRSRLMPGGRVVIISTRYHQDDLIGWLLSLEEMGGVDKWKVVNIPAIITTPEGEEKSYWPEYKPLPLLEETRDDPSLSRTRWNALYQGNPTPDEGNIIKREHFKLWPGDKAYPKLDSVIISCDTAYTDKTHSDYSSLQAWGIFSSLHTDSRGKEMVVPNAFLMANRVGKWQYPDLLTQVKELIKQYNPDRVVVENKASGIVLITDLRASGIPVHPYTPQKGEDKMSRVQAVLRFLVAGRVHVPERRWSDTLMDEATSFPYGKKDDQLDAMVLALLFLRDSHVLLTQDYWQADLDTQEKKPRKTYWSKYTRAA